MSNKILKTELAILEKTFPRNHGYFQIVLSSMEELVCRFTDTKGTKYTIQCNISVSPACVALSLAESPSPVSRCPSLPTQPNYPAVLPIWFSECDELFVVELIERLNTSDGASASSSHPVRVTVLFCCVPLPSPSLPPPPSAAG